MMIKTDKQQKQQQKKNIPFYSNFLVEFQSYNIISMWWISPEECLSLVCTINTEGLIRFQCGHCLSLRV